MNFVLYKEKKPSVLNRLDHLSSFMSNVFQDGLHYAFQLESEAGDILSFFLLSKNENMKKNIEYHENTKTKRRELNN